MLSGSSRQPKPNCCGTHNSPDRGGQGLGDVLDSAIKRGDQIKDFLERHPECGEQKGIVFESIQRARWEQEEAARRRLLLGTTHFNAL